MNKNLTELVLIVDRSGSMTAIRLEAENGINKFIEDQRAAKNVGEARLTLVQFDNEIETVHNALPLKDVPRYTLHPRSMTALLDAVGKTISQIGERLAKTPEEDRPGLVAVLIVTDGMENSSREYTKARVKEMIETQQKNYNWQFTYLGANQDAFAEAGSIGIHMAGNYAHAQAGTAYRIGSSNATRMRSAMVTGQSIGAANAFTPEELAEMAKEKEKTK